MVNLPRDMKIRVPYIRRRLHKALNVRPGVGEICVGLAGHVGMRT
jgi:hypothetical protein